MGLTPVFVVTPTPSAAVGHRADDGLPAPLDIHTLDVDALLALRPVALEGFNLADECSCESVEALLGKSSVLAIIRVPQPSGHVHRRDLNRGHLGS